MKVPKLPEKAKRFLVPGIFAFAALLIAGGFYFRQRSLTLIPQVLVPEEGGEVSGAQTGLPKNFPEDIPLFETSEILSSMESQERIQITLQTDGSPERVRRFYQQEMAEFGWKLTGVLTFEKDERGAQIIITSDPSGPTLIILNTTP